MLADSALPLALMLPASLVLAWQPRAAAKTAEDAPAVRLASPFSLQAALKFALIFLVLQIAGTLAQRALGEVGFYAVSLFAGLVASASGVAATAALAAHGTITAQVAGVGVGVRALLGVGTRVASRGASTTASPAAYTSYRNGASWSPSISRYPD